MRESHDTPPEQQLVRAADEDVRQAEHRQLVRAIAPEVAAIMAFTVRDDRAMAQAVEWQRLIKRRLTQWAEVYDPIEERQKATRKATIQERADHEAPLREGATHIAGELALYEDKRRAEHRRLALAAQAERDRREAEERQRVASEQARLRTEAEDARLAQAVAAEVRGDPRGAAALLEAPLVVPVSVARPVDIVALPPPPAPVAGQSFRLLWRAELDDLDTVIAQAAAGNANARAVLAFDPVSANRLATTLKGLLERAVPGLRAVSRTISVTRAP